MKKIRIVSCMLSAILLFTSVELPTRASENVASGEVQSITASDFYGTEDGEDFDGGSVIPFGGGLSIEVDDDIDYDSYNKIFDGRVVRIATCSIVQKLSKLGDFTFLEMHSGDETFSIAVDDSELADAMIAGKDLFWVRATVCRMDEEQFQNYWAQDFYVSIYDVGMNLKGLTDKELATKYLENEYPEDFSLGLLADLKDYANQYEYNPFESDSYDGDEEYEPTKQNIAEDFYSQIEDYDEDLKAVLNKYKIYCYNQLKNTSLSYLQSIKDTVCVLDEYEIIVKKTNHNKGCMSAEEILGYIEHPASRFFIKLDTNGGVFSDEEHSGYMTYEDSIYSDEEYELPIDEDVFRRGYEFIGWSYRKGNKDVLIEDDAWFTEEDIPEDTHLVLKAVWKKIELTDITIEDGLCAYPGKSLYVPYELNDNCIEPIKVKTPDTKYISVSVDPINQWIIVKPKMKRVTDEDGIEVTIIAYYAKDDDIKDDVSITIKPTPITGLSDIDGVDVISLDGWWSSPTAEYAVTVYEENGMKSDIAATDVVTWVSSNKKIATVDANGVVTALKNGSVTLTAKVTLVNGKVISKKKKISIYYSAEKLQCKKAPYSVKANRKTTVTLTVDKVPYLSTIKASAIYGTLLYEIVDDGGTKATIKANKVTVPTGTSAGQIIKVKVFLEEYHVEPLIVEIQVK